MAGQARARRTSSILRENPERDGRVPLCRPAAAFCYFFRVPRPMLTPRTRALAVAGTLAVTWIAGCGSSDRPPPAADTFVEPGSVGGSSSGFGGDGGVLLPGCGAKADGSSCDCVDAPLFTDPPNIYFVLDRSGSMLEDDKWGSVRTTVVALARGLGPRARFGAAMYPWTTDACTPGREVMKTRLGDAPSATGADGPTTVALAQVTNVAPKGGTPTAATLQALLPGIKALPGKTFVILATDGAPNCNPRASCGVVACVPYIEGACPSSVNCCEPPQGDGENCLDGQATVSAATAYASAGIPLYVVGIPGSAPYTAVLDEVAGAGGTALAGSSPKYYRVDDKSQILSALQKVAAKIVATCTFDLTEPPADPNAVNVYFDQVVVPKDPANGWSIEGKRVTLLGAACERVLSGDVLGVRIIAGCPTVGPR